MAIWLSLSKLRVGQSLQTALRLYALETHMTQQDLPLPNVPERPRPVDEGPMPPHIPCEAIWT
jgi:hypothetical protein